MPESVLIGVAVQRAGWASNTSVVGLEWRESAQRIQATRVFRNDPIAEELVNAELDLVLTRGKPIDVALADAHRMVQRRAQR
mgnify:CR=1 FL=1